MSLLIFFSIIRARRADAAGRCRNTCAPARLTADAACWCSWSPMLAVVWVTVAIIVV